MEYRIRTHHQAKAAKAALLAMHVERARKVRPVWWLDVLHVQGIVLDSQLVALFHPKAQPATERVC